MGSWEDACGVCWGRNGYEEDFGTTLPVRNQAFTLGLDGVFFFFHFIVNKL